jgi:hypothetical protein
MTSTDSVFTFKSASILIIALACSFVIASCSSFSLALNILDPTEASDVKILKKVGLCVDEQFYYNTKN